MSSNQGEPDPIRFAENVLQLLDRGGFVATYKYAVLLGLIDLCLEGTSRSGEPPETITTRQLAEKVLELYWPQTRVFETQDESGLVLRQNTGPQAKIIGDILRFKERLGVLEPGFQRAKTKNTRSFEKLLDSIEWKLIEMPLPRLQNLGGQSLRLLYHVGWTEETAKIKGFKPMVTGYQRGLSSNFDNRISLLPGVGRLLVQLNGLLRPLIHREWLRMVARINKLEVSNLERFLFGMDRASTARMRSGLVDLQEGRCFYCSDRLKGTVEIDHFIPWARYPDNGLDNLVATHRGCNNNKRDFLAAASHVDRWLKGTAPGSPRDSVLEELAQGQHWERHRRRTLGVARGLYLRLPESTMLWRAKGEFEPCRTDDLATLFASY